MIYIKFAAGASRPAGPLTMAGRHFAGCCLLLLLLLVLVHIHYFHAAIAFTIHLAIPAVRRRRSRWRCLT